MVSLNQINTEVDQKYGPFVVEDVPGGDVTLRNPVRLVESERAQLVGLNAEIKAAEGDVNKVIAAAESLLKLVSVGDGGKRLVAALDGDAAKLIHLVNLFTEATQMGEASRSES